MNSSVMASRADLPGQTHQGPPSHVASMSLLSLLRAAAIGRGPGTDSGSRKPQIAL